MRKSVSMFFAAAAITTPALALDDDFYGTYRLVSTSRRSLETGVVTPGDPERGFITYGRDGRMMVIIAHDGRPKHADMTKIDDAKRAELFKTVMAYGGTFSFDGKVMQHHIDISWNEAWNGITQVRDVRKEGGRLVYTTRPSRNSLNGDRNVTTLIWEKVATP